MRNGQQMVRWLAVAMLALATRVWAWEGSPFALKVETAAVADGHADVRVSVSVPPHHVIYVESFRVTSDGGASVSAVQSPAHDQKPDPFNPGKQVGVFAHPFESLWRVAPAKDGTRLTVVYQGCDDKVCFMPERHVFRFDASAGAFASADAASAQPSAAETASAADGTWSHGLAVTTGGGYMGADEFLAFLDKSEGKVAPEAGAAGLGGFLSDPVAFFHAHGMVLTLVLVLVGGVLLNLTPCVLPMIPVNLAIIGAGAGTRERGVLLGSAYGLGMVLVYGGLGWVILRFGLFFGALQSSPWFSLTVALIFVALSLALFDVFVIDFTRFSSSSKRFRRQGALAAFTAGAFSALLAGACVAPVVLAVLLLAGTLYAGGATAAQFLPFVLGLGMALPWPFAGAGLSVLPSPGMWMVRVKQVFGAFLLLLAAYYGYLAVSGFRGGSGAAAHGDSIVAGDRGAWDAKVAEARQAGKPLFVDFWAVWCKNCSAMERTTFRDARVKERLAGYVVVKVQAEQPEKSPAKEMLEAFDVRGLPGFVVLR